MTISTRLFIYFIFADSVRPYDRKKSQSPCVFYIATSATTLTTFNREKIAEFNIVPSQRGRVKVIVKRYLTVKDKKKKTIYFIGIVTKQLFITVLWTCIDSFIVDNHFI